LLLKKSAAEHTGAECNAEQATKCMVQWSHALAHTTQLEMTRSWLLSGMPASIKFSISPWVHGIDGYMNKTSRIKIYLYRSTPFCTLDQSKSLGAFKSNFSEVWILNLLISMGENSWQMTALHTIPSGPFVHILSHDPVCEYSFH
jgi:hypothetical protein